jgi:hypothetical protein
VNDGRPIASDSQDRAKFEELIESYNAGRRTTIDDFFKDLLALFSWVLRRFSRL